MPANLTPQYIEAEERFRRAKTDEEKLLCLEEMLSLIPKHKGTEKMQADIKRRISKLRAKQEEEARRGRRRTNPFAIERQGAGQVVLVGPPNVGKSLLFSRLTGVEAKVGDYPYSTTAPVPGMMPVEDVKVQLVDLPPVFETRPESWVGNLIRGADLLFIVVDASIDPLSGFEGVLKALAQMRVEPVPAGRRPVEPGPPFRKMAVVLANRCDLPGAEENVAAFCELVQLKLPLRSVSALHGTGLEDLRRSSLHLLDVVRAYTKVPGRPPDMDAPFVLPRGSTVLDLARAVHKEIAEGLQYARLWRADGSEPGIRVARDYELGDGDVLELHA